MYKAKYNKDVATMAGSNIAKKKVYREWSKDGDNSIKRQLASMKLLTRQIQQGTSCLRIKTHSHIARK